MMTTIDLANQKVPQRLAFIEDCYFTANSKGSKHYSVFLHLALSTLG